jgi:hypothetical protein
MIEYCLRAKDGDCAAGGLGKASDVIPFDNKYKDLVKEFLKVQADLNMAYDFYEHEKTATLNLRVKFYNVFEELKDAGVFDHKWHARTTWCADAYSEGCLEWFNDDYGPHKLADHIQ